MHAIMHAKYAIGFTSKLMGCAALGRCEREGRDRAEEERRYAEFLTREGYVVISVEGGQATVAADARGVVRSHTVASLTARLAAILDEELTELVEGAGSDSISDLAEGVDALNRARNAIVRARA